MNRCENGIHGGTCDECVGRYRDTGFDGWERYAEPRRQWPHDLRQMVGFADREDQRRVIALGGLLPVDHVWDGPVLVEDFDQMVMRADSDPAIGRF